MRKNILILYCCLMACLFSTCQQEADFTALPSGEVPVFFIEGTIGTEDLNLAAGDDGFFMFTSYEVSDSSFQLTGEIAHESGCDSDCRSLSITLHNYLPENIIETTDIPGDSTINLPVSPPPLQGTQQIEYTFIADDPEDNITTYHWEFLTLGDTLFYSADGTSATIQQEPSVTFWAKLTTTSAYDCIATTERRIDPVSSTINSCDCNIIVSADSLAYPVLYTDCPADYVWNDSLYEDSISTSSVGEENCLELSDQDGLYCRSCAQSYFLPNQQTPDICNTNFSYTAVPSTVVQNEEIPYANIVYRNADNTTFSSDLTIQPDDAFFNILSIQSYEHNSAGQATKLLMIDLSATLKAENSTTTHPIQIQGDFGIAHPD